MLNTIKIPQNQKEYDDMFSFGITEEEKKFLSQKQLKQLKETGILEGEFVYENGKPTKFISIDDIDFSLKEDLDINNFYIEIPKTKEEFKKRFGNIFK